jgi:L-2-hydroxyglutarate oxidase LhgO
MVERLDCAVIGAGVIGLAVARALAAAGREVVVLEAETTIGTGTSSRNSEVIHAGIYYAQGSLKARLCREGRDRLYRYLGDHGVAHRRCGKLIVATTESEIEDLRAVEAKARANGVADLRWLSAADVRDLEPAVACVAALLSPSTGILDSHGYMLSLQGEAEDRGAVIAFRSPVTGGGIADAGIRLHIGGPNSMTLHCTTVVNSAGLEAQRIAGAISGLPPSTIPPLYRAKGSYFALTGSAPFTRLVYPVPSAAGLGTHYTCDLGGQGRFGPDVEWVEAIDYDVDIRRADSFYAAIRRYWPDLRDGALQPAYAGIRPKVQAPGEPAADFVIQGPEVHGVPGLVNLYGIESPGLTASLAIADAVLERLNGFGEAYVHS